MRQCAVRLSQSLHFHIRRQVGQSAAIQSFLITSGGVKVMIFLKLTAIGSSEGFIVSQEARQKLGIKQGDTVFLTEAPDGALRLTPYNPDFARQMALAEQLMHDDREVLQALAK
jgi:putative addiction module antidote